MEIDDDCNNEIPDNLRNYTIYSCKIYTNKRQCSEIILTTGSILYEVKSKHILTSCDLSNSILKDKIPSGTQPAIGTNSNVHINVYFSYKKQNKEIFYFLQFDNHLIILGKADNHFMIHREFDYIHDYRVFDEHCTGESTVELNFINSTMESFELASLSYPKEINLRYPAEEKKKFENITRLLVDRVSEVDSKLAEIKSSMEKEFSELALDCQFINKDGNEEAVALARFGDVWVKNCNERIIIGIPVYNCSVRKLLIENIRVSLFCPEQTQLRYSQSIYEFRIENNRTTPANIEELCNIDANLNCISFDQEWSSNKNGVLFPDTAAIITIQTNLIHFNDPSTYLFDPIILYNVVLETGESKELQLYGERILLDTDILYDTRYAVQFNDNYVFRDLLAVIATTVNRHIEIKFEQEINVNNLENLLIEKLRFSNVKFGSKTKIDNTESFFTSQPGCTLNINDNDWDHKMFYNSRDGYWNQTLIRINRIKDADDDAEQVHFHLKLYNRSSKRIDSLIQLLSDEFGRKITILSRSCDSISNREAELRYQFKEETKALHKLATVIETHGNIDESHRHFLETQFETDLKFINLRNVTKSKEKI